MSRLSRLSATFALVLAAAALTAGPALARQHDHDRLPDKWEKRNHLNLKKDDSRGDRDHDGLSNYGEYRAHTNPRKKDSDHDGRRDGREDFDRDHLRNADEIRTGFDPGDADSDNDGVKDGRENAGTIVSLSGTSITIKLAVGGSLTAGLGDELDCSGSGTGSEEPAPDPAEDAPVPGGDDDPGDLPPLPDDGDADTGDAPDPPDAPFTAQAAQAGGEDADFPSDAESDPAFPDDAAGGADCGTATLEVGATVHKAKVRLTASGPMLVSVRLLGSRH
ncbi:MAG: hypothetical protein ABI611_20635 [Solirubrobacteraceae bacterium]